MAISLVLDIIIAVLLMLTIAYAVRLNQRLLQLRSDKNELLVLAKTFAEATVRAEKAIVNLKVSSETLSTEITKAEAIKDDLAYLVNRGGHTAEDMVDDVRGGDMPASSARSSSRPGSRAAKPQDASEETRLIEDAIRAATPGSEANEAVNPRDLAPRENTRRISGRPPSPSPSRAPAPFPQASSSRAMADLDEGEAIGDTPAARELLKALGSVE